MTTMYRMSIMFGVHSSSSLMSMNTYTDRHIHTKTQSSPYMQLTVISVVFIEHRVSVFILDPNCLAIFVNRSYRLFCIYTTITTAYH